MAAINAVAWCFAQASRLLFTVAAWRGVAWRLPARLSPWLMLTGTVQQFGLNLWGVDEAERYVPSGLVTMRSSTSVMPTAISAKST